MSGSEAKPKLIKVTSALRNALIAAAAARALEVVNNNKTLQTMSMTYHVTENVDQDREPRTGDGFAKSSDRPA